MNIYFKNEQYYALCLFDFGRMWLQLISEVSKLFFKVHGFFIICLIGIIFSFDCPSLCSDSK